MCTTAGLISSMITFSFPELSSSSITAVMRRLPASDQQPSRQLYSLIDVRDSGHTPNDLML